MGRPGWEAASMRNGSSDVVSSVNLAGCGILALSLFCVYIVLKSKLDPSWPEQSKVEATPKVLIMRGVVQRYSEKKQWGTITVHDSDSESDVEAKVPRPPRRPSGVPKCRCGS